MTRYGIIISGAGYKMESFNAELCTERHEEIKMFKHDVFKRIKAVENRWFLFMSALVANLIGVIAILITK